MKQILDEVDIINRQIPILEKVCDMLSSNVMTLKMYVTGQKKNLDEPSSVRFDEDGSIIATSSFTERFITRQPDFELNAELLEEEAIFVLKFLIDKKRNRRKYLKTLFDNKELP